MREIKFRALHIDEITGVESFVTSDEIGMVNFWYGIGGKGDLREDSVGQFIGLHDKNGKEIYEGDICKAKTDMFQSELHEVDPCIVTWDDKHSMFFLMGWQGTSIYRMCPEVIGNIYENPELLNPTNKE